MSEQAVNLDRDYLREHPDYFIENCLKILTKKDGLQPLRFNYTQRVVLRSIASLREKKLPPRLIILKSRQVGVSTVAEAIFFADALLNPFRSALVVAHKSEAAQGIFEMVRRYNRNLPPSLRQPERKDNVRQLEFEHDSRLKVEVEGDVRSMTVQGFHGSEVAFWKKPRATLTASMQALPMDPNTLAILESTANGQGNLFHLLWENAVRRRNDENLAMWERGWTPIFIPWWRHEEYRVDPWFMPNELSQEELDIAREYKLNLRQLAWRRWCVQHNCGGDPEVFAVEYPSNWREAFLRSGRPIFKDKELDYYREEQPPRGGDTCLWVVSKPSEIAQDSVTKKCEPFEQQGGRLRIFKPPHPRHTYVLFGDPSEGDPKSDPTPLEVLDQMTLEQVAEWWGRTPPDVLATFAAHLGWYYNTALVSGEANNHGIFYFATLLELGYPNIYFRTTHEESVAGEVTQKPGLVQTNKTKHAIVDTLRRFVREKRGHIYSPILLGEMASAVYDRKEDRELTRITKPASAHIDTVIAFGGALYTHRGSVESPLLPLPEAEIVTAAYKAALLRERDPEAAERFSVDITGMTGAELDRLFEIRHQRKMRHERQGLGGSR